MIDEKIEDYVEKHSSPESELLYELNRNTHLKVLNPRMISGHIQGKFLEMISHLSKPKRILEIGTYTGYSTICLASGLSDDGEIITIEVNEELESFASHYFEKAGISKKVKQLIGNAIDIIPKLSGKFDLVFLDADKENYCKYYELIKPLLNTGGTIIADNTLWSGKVIEEVSKNTKGTEGIKNFNDLVQNDPEVENVILSFRDGLTMIRKV
ncbi:MAG: O-methyltransferase [Hyphomicrobiales bacterium]